MYVRNGYDGNSETVNVLARHTALLLLFSRGRELNKHGDIVYMSLIDMLHVTNLRS